MSEQNRSNYKKLVEHYGSDKATEKELQAFFGLLHTNELDDFVSADMDEEITAIRKEQRDVQKVIPKKTVKLWPRIAVVAAVLIIFGSGLFYFSRNGQTYSLKSNYGSEIKPGHNGATLTLANGRVIHLSAAKTGIEIDASKLVYNDGSPLSSASSPEMMKSLEVGQVTLATSRGQMYQIILPDGSKVWLNAASSLKFPSTFIGLKSRTVQVNGEAYFEISKDKEHPFIVKSKVQQVQVLGTHFNVNSYEDEPNTTTTLLEGSVKVIAEGINDVVTLKPHQQSITGNNLIKVGDVDTDRVMDWKNNDFIFEDLDFKSAMRKISRWYDVEVIYDPSMPVDIQLGGWVSRKSNLSVVLQQMESTGSVHFKIEGRRITVTK